MSTFKGFSKQTPWGPTGALLVTLAALFGLEAVSLLVLFELTAEEGRSLFSWLSDLENNLNLLFIHSLVTGLLAVGLIYLFVRRRGGGLRELGFKSFKISKAVFLVLAGFVGFLAAAVTAGWLVELLVPELDVTAEQDIPFLDATGQTEIILTFLVLVVIAPVKEELIFRGFLLPAFSKAFGVVPAVVVTSIMFGLLHPPAIAMIAIGIFSLFLSWVYIKSGSIWPAIILHGLKNLLAFIAVVIIGV